MEPGYQPPPLSPIVREPEESIPHKLLVPVLIGATILLFATTVFFGWQNERLRHDLAVAGIRPSINAVPARPPDPTPTPDPKATIPPFVTELFASINQGLSTTIVPTTENTFYTIRGEIPQTSWKLDLTEVLNDKPQLSVVQRIFDTTMTADPDNSAGGAGQMVQSYIKDQIRCFFMLGINKQNYVSCAYK